MRVRLRVSRYIRRVILEARSLKPFFAARIAASSPFESVAYSHSLSSGQSLVVVAVGGGRQ